MARLKIKVLNPQLENIVGVKTKKDDIFINSVKHEDILVFLKLNKKGELMAMNNKNMFTVNENKLKLLLENKVIESI